MANVPEKRTRGVVMTTSVPLNPHMTQNKREKAEEESVMVKVGLSPRKVKRGRRHCRDFKNLRELVFDATGIAPPNQTLLYATRRLKDAACKSRLMPKWNHEEKPCVLHANASRGDKEE